MAFLLGNQIVLSDTETGHLSKLQINGTDVLTLDGSTITLKNVDIADSIEGSINSDNVAEGSTNRFFTAAREAVFTNLFNSNALAILTEKTRAEAEEADIRTDFAAADATTLSSAQSYADTIVASGTGSLDTDDITEAGNLYYTDARADVRATLRINDSTTDNIDEGSNNLYYTDARAQAKIDALVDAAPGTLDTLNELAAALGDDANFSTTVTNLIGAETTRATAAEGVNATAIGAETTRATAAEGVLGTGISNLSVSTTNAIAALNHDTLSGFVANEHIDWTAASAGTIDPSNYVNTGNTTYTAGNGLNLNTTEFEMSGSYTGDFTATGDVTAYSDERLKRNIETINKPIDIVNALRGVKFEKDGRHSTGVIAQEVEKVLPEVVHTDADGMKSVAYGNVVGVLIEAIKEQQKQIDWLTSFWQNDAERDSFNKD